METLVPSNRASLETSERYRALLEINNAVITHLKKEDLFRAVCNVLRTVVPYDAVGIALYEPALDAFRFYALEGGISATRYAVGSLLNRDDCCFGAAFDGQASVLRRDLAWECVFRSDEQLRAEGMRSYCTVPFIVRGKSTGGLSVVSREPDRYSAEDASLLQEVANQLALAVENMRAYEENELLRKRLHLENDYLKEEMCEAESQVLLAENAALMSRFAAALAHELNSPVGALVSALDSSLTLSERESSLPLAKQAELPEVKAGLKRTLVEASDRLREIVSRMQRFTNLDRSEILTVDVNVLIRDVVGLIRSSLRPGVRVGLELRPLPVLRLRPQQISTVFMSLLQNALDDANGAKQVEVSSEERDGQALVVVSDDGRGLTAGELQGVFEPAFKVKGKRVTSNWSLFGARQMILSHGGRIDIQSAPGRGTKVRVSLPLPLA